jgi:hypothetical protein
MTGTLLWINLTLRGLMEAGIIAALGFWGLHTGSTPVLKALLGIGAPLLGFGFWGLVDFHQAGSLAEPLRLAQELIITGLAVIALYQTNQPGFGLALAVVFIVQHALVYGTGGSLLKK